MHEGELTRPGTTHGPIMNHRERSTETPPAGATREDVSPVPPAQTPPGPPERIGRYRLLRVLGEGGFGRVYLAHDDDLHRPVAIKVARPERVARAQDMDAYLEEARNLARLDHPHIVPIYDLGRTEDGLAYIVSKFIEGSDLAAVIRDARPPRPRAAELVATVAEALHYAHGRGLVHRDVKPDARPDTPSTRRCRGDLGSTFTSSAPHRRTRAAPSCPDRRAGRGPH